MKPTTPITLDPTQLPDDLELLKSLVKDLLTTLQDQTEHIETLKHQLHEALRRHYGRKTEAMDPDQLNLFLRQIENELLGVKAPEVPVAEVKKAVEGHGRRKPSQTLPVERTVYPLAEEKKTCPDCGHSLNKIGEEVRALVDYVPASFVLKEQVSEKWACSDCQGNVVASELPAKPIERGMAGAGLLAQVIVGKYGDHLPLYRQSEIYERQGFEVSRSTLCDWIAQSADLLAPLVEAMKVDVLQSKVIHTDDTPVPVLDEKPEPKEGAPPGEEEADEPFKRKARLGRLWVYVGDEEHEHIVFDYTPDRKGERPRAYLLGWKGHLQADAYAGYDAMYAKAGVVEVACWAHARRKFHDAYPTAKPQGKMALAYIHQLYMVEKLAKGLSPEERKEIRQKHARPILDAFKQWLDAQVLILLPKSAMGLAVGHSLNQWDALNCYVGNGALAIDNNKAERALRCVAVGRKNWLFAGSDLGGRNAAILYSLVASCKLHKVESWAYLRDVIGRVKTHPASQIAELLPANWKPTVVSPAAQPEPVVA